MLLSGMYLDAIEQGLDPIEYIRGSDGHLLHKSNIYQSRILYYINNTQNDKLLQCVLKNITYDKIIKHKKTNKWTYTNARLI